MRVCVCVREREREFFFGYWLGGGGVNLFLNNCGSYDEYMYNRFYETEG